MSTLPRNARPARIADRTDAARARSLLGLRLLFRPLTLRRVVDRVVHGLGLVERLALGIVDASLAARLLRAVAAGAQAKDGAKDQGMHGRSFGQCCNVRMETVGLPGCTAHEARQNHSIATAIAMATATAKSSLR